MVHHKQTKRYRKLKVLSVFFGLALGMLTAIVVFRSVAKEQTPRFFGNYVLEGFEDHPFLGYAPRANTVLHSCKVFESDTLYCVTYTLDSMGRRVVPINNSATKHVLFYGCSYTYGEGVNDEETFAYRLGIMRNDLQLYNHAYSGYGPQHMLASLQFVKPSTYVSQQQGYLIYMMLPEHVYRATGKPYYLQGWGSSSPHYALEGDSLVYYANHFDWRPCYTNWQKFLGWSGLGSYLYQLPSAYAQSDIELIVAMFKRAKQAYLTEFPNGRFVVVMMPAEQADFEIGQLKAALDSAGIDVFDLHDLYPVASDYIIPNDAHPSAKAHLELAKAISDFIK